MRQTCMHSGPWASSSWTSNVRRDRLDAALLDLNVDADAINTLSKDYIFFTLYTTFSKFMTELFSNASKHFVQFKHKLIQ